MSQTVLKVSTTDIKKMKEYYKDNLKANIPSSAAFAAKVSGCTITAYNSGKVLFQGSNHQIESQRWGGTSVEKKKTEKKQKTIPDCVNLSHIGTDEAGSGDFFGPMTAAAAYVSEKNIPLLKELGVRDSKAMSDETVRAVAKEIQMAEIPYSLFVLHNPKYNNLQSKGWTQGKMKAMLHFHAIEKLKKKITGSVLDGIVVDQFAERQVFNRHIASEGHSMPDKMNFLTKAESYSIAVAAASILSRAKFLKEMDRLSDEIGFKLQKGASKLVDEQAAKIILVKGKSVLTDITKVHFANTQKAEMIVNKRRS
jgi:ribonuclease HIII